MPKRSSKNTASDTNQLAARVVGRIIAQDEEATLKPEKNPAAVELGRRGGLKGGKARAASMSQSRRSEIARAAAEARWKKKDT